MSRVALCELDCGWNGKKVRARYEIVQPETGELRIEISVKRQVVETVRYGTLAFVGILSLSFAVGRFNEGLDFQQVNEELYRISKTLGKDGRYGGGTHISEEEDA